MRHRPRPAAATDRIPTQGRQANAERYQHAREAGVLARTKHRRSPPLPHSHSFALTPPPLPLFFPATCSIGHSLLSDTTASHGRDRARSPPRSTIRDTAIRLTSILPSSSGHHRGPTTYLITAAAAFLTRTPIPFIVAAALYSDCSAVSRFYLAEDAPRCADATPCGTAKAPRALMAPRAPFTDITVKASALTDITGAGVSGCRRPFDPPPPCHSPSSASRPRRSRRAPTSKPSLNSPTTTGSTRRLSPGSAQPTLASPFTSWRKGPINTARNPSAAITARYPAAHHHVAHLDSQTPAPDAVALTPPAAAGQPPSLIVDPRREGIQARAIRANDIAAARYVLITHPDPVYDADRRGRTALHLAADSGLPTLAILLLAARVVVNARDSDGYTTVETAEYWAARAPQRALDCLASLAI